MVLQLGTGESAQSKRNLIDGFFLPLEKRVPAEGQCFEIIQRFFFFFFRKHYVLKEGVGLAGSKGGPLKRGLWVGFPCR